MARWNGSGFFLVTGFGPKRSFGARSALALAVARVTAGAARRGLMLERASAERADYPVVLAPTSQALRAIVSLAATFVVPHRSGRRTHCAPCGRCVRTAAARMTTKCAARTDPCGPLLGAPEIAPAGLRLPRRWAFGIRCSGLPQSNQVAGSGRRCVRRSGIKGEPAGRRTAAEPNAPSAWSQTKQRYSRLSCFRERPITSAMDRRRTLPTRCRSLALSPMGSPWELRIADRRTYLPYTSILKYLSLIFL